MIESKFKEKEEEEKKKKRETNEKEKRKEKMFEFTTVWQDKLVDSNENYFHCLVNYVRYLFDHSYVQDNRTVSYLTLMLNQYNVVYLYYCYCLNYVVNFR